VCVCVDEFISDENIEMRFLGEHLGIERVFTAHYVTGVFDCQAINL